MSEVAHAHCILILTVAARWCVILFDEPWKLLHHSKRDEDASAWHIDSNLCGELIGAISAEPNIMRSVTTSYSRRALGPTNASLSSLSRHSRSRKPLEQVRAFQFCSTLTLT